MKHPELKQRFQNNTGDNSELTSLNMSRTKTKVMFNCDISKTIKKKEDKVLKEINKYDLTSWENFRMIPKIYKMTYNDRVEVIKNKDIVE